MAVSPVEICNLALSWLGGDLIISLTDPSTEAKLCNAVYASLRDAVLEEREWTFAVRRIQPAALVAQPVYGYDKAFQIPVEVIRILQVSRAGEVVDGGVIDGSFRSATRGGTGMGRESRIEWAREEDMILCNRADAVFIRAIVQITDTTKFSPAFDQALAARIAMDLAQPLTNSRQVQKDMAGFYADKIKLAAASDGLQGRSHNFRSDAFTVIR